MAHEILVVDDEPDIRLLIEGILRDEGYETRGAGDAPAAIAAFRARRPNLVILDVWLQGSRMDGLGILETLHSEEPHVPVVMISGHGTIEMAVGAIQLGAYDFIEKPFQSDRLLLVVRRALEAAALARENIELRLRAGPEATLIGELRADRPGAFPGRARRPHRLPRDDLRPRRIRQGSRRPDDPRPLAPLIRPVRRDELRHPQSSPFRRRTVRAGGRQRPRGASQARRRAGARAWRHAAAGRGVRHAARNPGQDRARFAGPDIRAPGGIVRVKVDVRVLSTTNRDLQAEIAAGRFREDLYYRLAVVPVKVPALSERREDVPVLATHFIGRSAESSGIPVRALSADTLGRVAGL